MGIWGVNFFKFFAKIQTFSEVDDIYNKKVVYESVI